MSLVEARDLFCVYPGADGGVAALQGLTLDVEEGEICVILGPSGSGKTTLMRVLAGFERPSAGSIAVTGLQLGALSQRRLADYRATTLGYADQHYWRALAGELTAEELVAVPLGLQGIPEQERRARAHELLERVGLRDRADAHPGELSGGEQQRIALCAALAHRPRLLIADEPTGELDELSAAAVYSLLAELSREEGVTALVVSHDPRSAAIADRVIHIRDGRVSEERSGESAAVVIGRGGWMRIPEEALHDAGIVDRATVTTRDGVVELRPLGASEATAPMLPDIEGAAGVLVELRGVTRRYGQDIALDDLTTMFAPGRLSVVTGPSGSGKSTLLSLVSGLDLPDEGEVLIGGRSMSGLDRDARARFRRDTVAFIGQSPGLSGFLTARENVELGLAIRGIEGIDAHERAIDALVAVGLAEHADRLADLLSAGQRERVAVARALAARTPVIIADEPTSRVDVAAALTLGGLFADIAHEHGTTFICATHDPVLIGFADVDVQLRRAGAPVPSV
jgi:ABC-type lipoprotein export system ATPase subunit